MQWDAAPGITGGTYGNLQLIGLNNPGQVAFLADINGGSSPRAVYLYDGENVSLVAKSNDPAPGGSDNFNLPPGIGNYILNLHGNVAFFSNVNGETPGIWIGGVSAPPEKVVRQNDPTGIAGYGNYYAPPVIRGFNDSGLVLFDSPTSGGPGYALFLKDLEPAVTQVVFQRNQAGGPGGQPFFATMQAVLNNEGKVAFLARSQSFIPGWYLGSGAGSPPQAIAVQGAPTPIGGSFGFAGRNVPAVLNGSGQVLFIGRGNRQRVGQALPAADCDKFRPLSFRRHDGGRPCESRRFHFPLDFWCESAFVGVFRYC